MPVGRCEMITVWEKIFRNRFKLFIMVLSAIIIILVQSSKGEGIDLKIERNMDWQFHENDN